MDAVLTVGFPGSLAALWQQAGRAGRDGRDALAVLLAKPDPLDSWLCDHPESLFDTAIEATVLHPEQPAVLAAHLAAAAQELPVSAGDEEFFGSTMPGLLEGTDDCYVGRLRTDPSVEHGLQLWIVADQLRKGAALNAVQVAELLAGRR